MTVPNTVIHLPPEHRRTLGESFVLLCGLVVMLAIFGLIVRKGGN